MVKSKVVEATGTASATQYGSKDIQDAMVAAINECIEKGITDPEAIKAAQLKAREEVKRKWASGELKSEPS